MATGFPVKANYATGDVLTAANMNDLAGTLNYLDPTAKGDLFPASDASTLTRLAVGTDGQVLTADSTQTTGIKWATASSVATSLGFTAGKNKIINGDFNINQRNFTSNTTSGSFNFDRFTQQNSGGTTTVTPQTFTAGTAPVSGYEGKNFLQIVTATQSAAGDYAAIEHRIESVRSFANQAITVSFWAKASSGTPNVGVSVTQDFGTSGSASVITSAAAVQAITTSWTRYSFNITVPSISGKTIGTANDMLKVDIWTSAGTTISGAGYPAVGVQNATIGLWGIQAEAGSTATSFQTATGTIQAELAACQRYYEKTYAQGTAPATSTQSNMVGNPSGGINSTATGYFGYYIPFKVTKRSSPTITLYDAAGTSGKVSKYESVNLTKTDGITGSADAIGDSSIRVTMTSVSGYSGFAFHYVADSEL